MGRPVHGTRPPGTSQSPSRTPCTLLLIFNIDIGAVLLSMETCTELYSSRHLGRGLADGTIWLALYTSMSFAQLTHPCCSRVATKWINTASLHSDLHRPYTKTLSGSTTDVFSVTRKVKAKVKLQKAVNKSCHERMKQNTRADNNILMDEECIVSRLNLVFRFALGLIETQILSLCIGVGYIRLV